MRLINQNESDNTLLIRALAAWRASRAEPERAEADARAVIAACGRGDREALVIALRACGWIERIRFDHDAALATLTRATRLASAGGLADRAAEALITRAGVHLEVGRAARARRDLVRARELAGGATSAELENQFGILEATSGDTIAAVAHFRAAVAASADAAEPLVQFMALNNLGLSLTSMGRSDEAVEMLRTAERVAANVGRFAHGAAIQSLAVALAGSGRLADALGEFTRAAGVLDGSGWPAGEAYLERIEVLAGLRLMREADRAAAEAIRHLSGPGGVMLRADALLAHARVLMSSARFEEAADAAAQALDGFRGQRRTVLAAAARVVSVRADLARGVVGPGAAAQVARAARQLEAAGWVDHAADAHLCGADIARLGGRRKREQAVLREVVRLTDDGPALIRLRGHVAATRLAETPAGVEAAARRGLVELSRFRATLPTPELRALASGHGRELAEAGLRAALERADCGAVMEWIERGRMASSLVRSQLPSDDMVDVALAQLRELQSTRASVAPEEAGEIRAVERRLERRIERRLRLLGGVDVRVDESPTATQILAAMEDGTGLLSLVDVDGRLRAAVAASGDVTIHDLGPAGVMRRAVDEILVGLRRVVRARTPASGQAARAGVEASVREMDGAFAAVIAGRLGDCAHLVIAPTPGLLPAPWHALGSVGERGCSVVPSVTLWLRDGSSADRDGDVVVVCGPDLPGAARELTCVERAHGAATALAHPRAAVVDVAAALEGAALAHLACHGRIRVDNPSFSSLRLSDGDLTLLDVERLRRPPRVMVLSACDVGAATTLPGQELRGFLSAALTAGTRAVVASAVPVHDEATVDLMAAFHGGLARGLPLGDALRAAQECCDDGTPTAFVGRMAFTCYGDARAVVAGARSDAPI